MEVEVSGSAPWKMSNFPTSCACDLPPCDPCNIPKIIFTACSDQLTGDVDLLTGWFQAGTVAGGAGFCTTGNLYAPSTSSATVPVDEDPRIVVCPNEEARFGGSCANFCGN